MPRSIGVSAYLLTSRLAGRYARRLVDKRIVAGKEDPARVGERFGNSTMPRPAGRLVWFHAASVGEALSVLDLIKKLLKRHADLHVMVTTVTTTSAEILTARLPDRAFHQFVPVDTWDAVGRFLDHWSPDLAIWTESELWPTLLHRTNKRGVPMLLINARMSARSARRYRWLRNFAPSLLNRFARVLTQDDAIADTLYQLGVQPDRLEVTGSLKDTAEALPVDDDLFKAFGEKLSGKHVWLAASTHEGEEEAIAAAHRYARKTTHHLILILVPRHPERGPAILSMLRDQRWNVACRSKGDKLDRHTDIYLADTIGEMGLWYRLAAVSFVGGSLVEVGGHNPFEPALLGSAILFGPHVFNFESAYQRFEEAGGAVRVNSADDLGPKLADTLPADRTAHLANAAWTVSSDGADVAERVLQVIASHLPEPAT